MTEDIPTIVSSNASDVDLDITDTNGNVIARFAGGHIQTKNFNSATPTEVETDIRTTDALNVDLDIADPAGYVMARFTGGHVKTKNFDSESVLLRIAALEGASGSGYLVPSYWVSYLEAKESTINELNTALTTGESFVFFTDYHQNTNNGNSMPLIRHILDHTSVTDVIYGGDTTDGGLLPNSAAAYAVMRNFANMFRGTKLKPVRGNHDCEPSAYQTTNQISDSAFYDFLIRPIEKEIVSGGKLYYYFDNTNQKIRHIVLDSGGMNNPLDSTQLTWFKARLTELDSGWTVFLHQHMVVESTPAQESVHLISRGTATLNAVGEVYDNLNCTIAAFVCGHLHVDTVMDTDYNFKIIGTTCDAGGANSNGYDWNNPTRPAGTTNEQAFDVYSVDTTARTIHITRIGAGSDRTVTY